MAFKEVDPGPMPEGEFFRFNAIGDKAAGIFVSVAEDTNQFGKTQRNYTFKNKGGTFIVTANFDLDRRLKKAELKPGYAVIITYVSDLPPTKPGMSPMRQFKVLVDDSPQKPAPKPPVSGDDDLPF